MHEIGAQAIVVALFAEPVRRRARISPSSTGRKIPVAPISRLQQHVRVLLVADQGDRTHVASVMRNRETSRRVELIRGIEADDDGVRVRRRRPPSAAARLGHMMWGVFDRKACEPFRRRSCWFRRRRSALDGRRFRQRSRFGQSQPGGDLFPHSPLVQHPLEAIMDSPARSAVSLIGCEKIVGPAQRSRTRSARPAPSP